MKGALEQMCLFDNVVWDKHEEEDALFLVLEGNFKIELKSKILELTAGEIFIFPCGRLYKPMAEKDEKFCFLSTNQF